MSVEQPSSTSPGSVSTDDSEAQTGAENTESYRPTVLIIDESVRTELFEMWLTDACTVRTAANPAEVREHFDESVMVALIRNESGDEAKALVEKQIQHYSPFCRTIVTTTEHVEIMFPGIAYDVCLHEPTTQVEVRETVERLSRRAAFQSILREYYRLTMSLANREISKSSTELLEDSKYDSLQAKKDGLLAILTRLQSSFDSDDLRAVQESLRPEQAFGPDATKRNKESGNKHRPKACVGCGREWSTKASSEERSGYRRLGSFVWKCTACGTVQKLPDPSHRRVAK